MKLRINDQKTTIFLKKKQGKKRQKNKEKTIRNDEFI